MSWESVKLQCRDPKKRGRDVTAQKGLNQAPWEGMKLQHRDPKAYMPIGCIFWIVYPMALAWGFCRMIAKLLLRSSVNQVTSSAPSFRATIWPNQLPGPPIRHIAMIGCNQIHAILLAYLLPKRYGYASLHIAFSPFPLRMATPGDPTAVDTIDTINDLPKDVPCHARDDLEKRLLRKIDLRMSILLILYTLNLIDTTNISNARLQGFENDLHLHGQQYATTLSILLVGYIIMQVPGNMFLHWVERPSVIIPCCIYTGILAARFFLGFAEAPFFPGMIFLVSKWYKRDELALRIALVTCGSFLSSAFGSLLASAILHGGVTILVAICAIFVLPDFPHNTRWMTPEERALAISRLVEDGYSKADEVGKQTTMQGVRDAVSDWKVWWFSVAATFQIVGCSFFGYFPTLCATLGYDTTVTLLLCAPPWVFAAIVAFILTGYSDKKQKRYKCFVISNAFGVLAFTVSAITMNKVARYISLFVIAQIIVGYMVLLGWISNIFAREPAKRAIAIALMNALAQIGGIIGSYVWPLKWGPSYRYSYVICITAIGVSTGMCGAVSSQTLRSANLNVERSCRADLLNSDATRRPMHRKPVITPVMFPESHPSPAKTFASKGLTYLPPLSIQASFLLFSYGPGSHR
ncbi:major facilitator superfamily domain-containing protein [Suillus subluteus]|nr:major facilitator superfamily domain-containing protein [Suillus subluteus]